MGSTGRRMARLTLDTLADLPLEGATTVHHVRLRVLGPDGTSPGRLWKMAELSLFE